MNRYLYAWDVSIRIKGAHIAYIQGFCKATSVYSLKEA